MDPQNDDYRFSSVWVEAKDIDLREFKTIPMGFIAYYAITNGLNNIEAAMAYALQSHERQLACAAWGAVSTTLDKATYRSELNDFIESNTEWVTRSHWSFHEYWINLAKYKFFLMPRGHGIQSPKIYEALFVCTVPVVLRIAAYDDLEKLGFPLLIVDKWDEVNPSMLEEAYETRFKSTDWLRVREMVSVENVMNLLRKDV